MSVKADLKEKQGRLQKLQDDLGKIFKEAKTEDGGIDLMKAEMEGADSKARAEKIAQMNQEMTDLGKEIETLQQVLKAEEGLEESKKFTDEPVGTFQHPGGNGEKGKSFGKHFVESDAFKNYHGGQGPSVHLDVEVKTLFQRTAGWAPESTRTGKVVEYATRPIQVTDLIPSTTTTQSSIKYMEETTFTNAAAETAEAGTYPEAALALTEKSVTVEKVAVWLPVTDEQLEDVARVEQYVDNRLRFMLMQRLDEQILTGDGVTPNLLGILNKTGIQTQAKGADPVPDAIYKAITKIRVTGRAIPNATIQHPNDWQDIRLLRTSDGLYIWGNPSEAGPERIWGLGVVQSDAETENTGLVGDFVNFSEVSFRRGVDIQVTNAHSDFFIKGKQAIRADFRCAVIWYRPAAFCTVTSI